MFQTFVLIDNVNFCSPVRPSSVAHFANLATNIIGCAAQLTIVNGLVLALTIALSLAV